MKREFQIVAFCLALVFVRPGSLCLATEGGHAGSGPAARHPISVTQIDAFVSQNMLTMRCSFYADDLEFIHGVEPDEETGLIASADLKDAFDEHALWLLEKVDVFNAAGERLTGRLVEKGPFDLPPEGVDSIKLMDYFLNVTLEYDLAEPPQLLTFRHDINDPNFLRPSEVKLVVKQAGSDALYGSNMKGQIPETVRFDWENPLSRSASGEELKAWYERQQDETLGLSNYGGVYSFIYITPHETRHEILIPVAILVSEVRIEQADPYFVEVEEQEAARERIREFFKSIATMTINGQSAEPRFDRLDFGGLDIRDFAMTREPKRVSVANGRVGVIMSWPTRKLPDSVEVEWKHFNEKYMRTIDSAMIGPDSTGKRQFSMYLADNRWKWNNPGLPPLPEPLPVALGEHLLRPAPARFPLPSAGFLAIAAAGLAAFVFRRTSTWGGATIVAVALIAAYLMWPVRIPVHVPGAEPPPIADSEAKTVFDTLIRNMFRAFDYSSEEDIYDSLAASVSGPLLKDLYLKMRKSLEVKEQGGAVATIENVDVVRTDLYDRPAAGPEGPANLAPPGFAIRANWKIKGTIEHWGHIHQRTNLYDAVFNVQNVNGQWKITEYETLDEKQGPVSYGPRKLD